MDGWKIVLHQFLRFSSKMSLETLGKSISRIWWFPGKSFNAKWSLETPAASKLILGSLWMLLGCSWMFPKTNWSHTQSEKLKNVNKRRKTKRGAALGCFLSPGASPCPCSHKDDTFSVADFPPPFLLPPPPLASPPPSVTLTFSQLVSRLLFCWLFP